MKLKYPKFLLLIMTFVLAYFVLQGGDYPPVRAAVAAAGYGGAFLAGIFYAYSFTGALATAVFLIFGKSLGVWGVGLLAGLGSLLADLLIFRFIRQSFADEIDLLKKERMVLTLGGILPFSVKKIILPVLGALVIASPLPDELGVTLLAVDKRISAKMFAVLSYVLNTAGILIILYIGSQ